MATDHDPLPLAERLYQRAGYLYNHKQRRISRQDYLDMLTASAILSRLAPASRLLIRNEERNP